MGSHSTVRICPKLEAEGQVLQRMRAYAMASEIEVSGLGQVRANPQFWPECITVLDELYLPKQEGSWGQTALDTDGLLAFTTQLAMAGKDTSRYRVWWHSHVRMPARFSYQDDATINQLVQTWPFVVAIVVNHFGEAQCRYTTKTASLELDIKIPQPSADMLTTCRKDVARQVTAKSQESWWEKGHSLWRSRRRDHRDYKDHDLLGF